MSKVKKTEFTLGTLQRKNRIWADRNFPNRQPHYPLLGVGEELGELAEAENIVEKLDAIADAVIYLADYCNQQSIDMSIFYLLEDYPRHQSGFNIEGKINACLLRYLGKLNHAHLKGEQKIRYTEDRVWRLKVEAIQGILMCLSQTVQAINREDHRIKASAYDLLAIVESVWSKVEQRDWLTNPTNAHEKVV